MESGITISKNFLLGGLVRKSDRSIVTRGLESIVAAGLFLLCLPLFLTVLLGAVLVCKGRLRKAEVVKLPAEVESRTWQTYSLFYVDVRSWGDPAPAGWSSFFWRFIPGLLAVMRGNLSFTGLPARTVAQISSLPRDWRVLYLSGKAGLITEAAVTYPDDIFQTDDFLAEAC